MWFVKGDDSTYVVRKERKIPYILQNGSDLLR